MAEKIMQINMEKEAKIKREAGMLSPKNDVNTFVAAGAVDKDVKIKQDEVLTENKAEETQMQPKIAEKEVQDAVKELSAAAEQAIPEATPPVQEKSEGNVSDIMKIILKLQMIIKKFKKKSPFLLMMLIKKRQLMLI
jgi:hypothetical protein